MPYPLTTQIRTILLALGAAYTGFGLLMRGFIELQRLMMRTVEAPQDELLDTFRGIQDVLATYGIYLALLGLGYLALGLLYRSRPQVIPVGLGVLTVAGLVLGIAYVRESLVFANDIFASFPEEVDFPMMSSLQSANAVYGYGSIVFYLLVPQAVLAYKLWQLRKQPEDLSAAR